MFEQYSTVGAGFTWHILENSFALKEQKRIGTFSSLRQFVKFKILNVVGIHQIECTNPENGETAVDFQKFTNVSEQYK